jgi:GDP-L-fucose synthase
MLTKKSKIFVAGHKGMVGSAILRLLKNEKYTNLITVDKKQLNLLDQKKVFSFLKRQKPDYIIIAAAKVGGIFSNLKYKAEYFYENIQIQNNLIHGSYINKIRNLIFLGSSCIYPKYSKQPFKEKDLLKGEFEPTNDAYSLAKVAGIKMCEYYNHQYNLNYKCLMPSNVYGQNDNYDSDNSHFFPALLKKIHTAKVNNAKEIELWGSGKAKREIIFVEDLADACIYFLGKKTSHTLINIGSGIEYTIKTYAEIIMKNLNCRLKIFYDTSKPDGMKRKIMNLSIANSYGWKAKTSLKKGIIKTYIDFLKVNNFKS